MKKYALFIFLAVLAIAGGGYGAYATRYQKPTVAPVVASETKTTPVPVKQTLTVTDLLTAVNATRASAGVRALAMDQRLNISAQAKADDMAKNGYFDHANPATGKHGYEYAHEAMPSCTGVGENLLDGAINSTTTKSVMLGWISSKPHYEAMTSTIYAYTGFGIASSNDKIYIVEHFCQL